MSEKPASESIKQDTTAAQPSAVLRTDPLLECLVTLARIHAQPRSRDALVAGLPLVNNRLTPSLFKRAARRAGLASKITQRPIASINPALLPVVLLLKDGNACWWSGSSPAASLA